MSSSPTICASPNFIFPATKSSPVKEDTFDYFSISNNIQSIPEGKHSSAKGSKTHAKFNDSISSINSDQTLVSSHPRRLNKRTDSSLSTETLIDDPVKNISKNFMNLSLAVPKTKYHPSSFSAVDNTNGSRDSNKIEQRRLSSATESNFPEDYTNPPAENSAVDTTPEQPFFPITTSISSSSSDSISIPKLRKQRTLPNLELSFNTIQETQLKNLSKFHNIPRLVIKKDLSSTLSSEVRIINSADLCNTLSNDVAPILVVDIRPFNDYVKSHIQGAINVCLPSTLLKRPNYSLSKCINSLSDYERVTISDFCNRDSAEFKVVLYDNYSTGCLSNNSQNLSHMCQKFINDWKEFHVYVLQNGFQEFLKHFQDFTESGAASRGAISNNHTNINSNSETVTGTNMHMNHSNGEISKNGTLDNNFQGNDLKEQNKDNSLNAGVTNGFPNTSSTPRTPGLHTKSSSLNGASFFSTPHKRPSPHSSRTFSVGSGSPRSDNTPVLSRFLLPETKSFFKIRHNEEQLIVPDLEEDSSNFQLLVDYRDLSILEKEKLPKWIMKSSSEICKEFTNLELLEQSRLTNALNMGVNSSKLDALGGLSSPPPTISSGIEYGYKNRYKDIFLYEHSRVKLNDFERTQQCDYINASYLRDGDDIKYIATQGPLQETIGDFWKCVVNDKVPLIVSLTQETENGVSKCSPFWKPGKYRSNFNSITVTELESETIQPIHEKLLTKSQSIIFRSFEIKIDESMAHKVIQIQVLSWPDMDLIMNPKDLLSIVFLKNYLLKEIDSTAPVLVHCSAGCGRTGSLCAVDTVIETLINTKVGSDNLIYDTVNRFRKQRVSMVQTVRQYLLIYDLILIFLRNRIYSENNEPVVGECQWDSFNDLNIVQNFINQAK